MSRSAKVALKNRDRYIELGLNISFYRKREAMTQEQLAEKAGLSRSYLGEIEAPNMIKSISLESLFNIADALGIAVHRLLEFRE